MRAGDLRSRVTIQAQSQACDGLGQPLLQWADIAVVWAKILYLRGTVTVAADAVQSVAGVSIRIRYRADVKAAMRVVYGDSVFRVLAVLPDEEGRQFVDLVCELPS